MATSGVSNNSTIDEIIKKTTEKSSARKTGGELGKDDFLNLLVTQLRYQDPLKPEDDKEFIAQMAQFSSLEQMQNMNSTLGNSQAFALVGKYVTATDTDPKTAKVTQTAGQVTSVRIKEGKTYVLINNKEVEASKVTQVDDSIYGTGGNLSAYTNLIGYRVKGVAYDSSTGDVISLDGDVKAIQKGLNEDYMVMDNVNVNISEINTDTQSTDPNYMSNYLKDNVGKKVSVIIKDTETGKKVPVSATLKSYNIENGKVTGVLDDLNLSVDSVANIRPIPK